MAEREGHYEHLEKSTLLSVTAGLDIGCKGSELSFTGVLNLLCAPVKDPEKAESMLREERKEKNEADFEVP